MSIMGIFFFCNREDTINQRTQQESKQVRNEVKKYFFGNILVDEWKILKSECKDIYKLEKKIIMLKNRGYKMGL